MGKGSPGDARRRVQDAGGVQEGLIPSAPQTLPHPEEPCDASCAGLLTMRVSGGRSGATPEIQLSNSPTCIRRTSSPRVSSGPRACRSYLFLLSPRGVRNDRAFHRARGAMCRSPWLRVLKAHGKHSHGSSATPAFRTRMDFAACCIADRELSLAPTPPGPCELSHGHALGPSARRVGVTCPSARGSRL